MWNWKVLLGLAFGVGVSTNTLIEVDRLQKIKANRLDEWVRAQVEMVDLDAAIPPGGLPTISRGLRAGLRELPNVTGVFPHLYKSDFEVSFPNGTNTATRLLITEKGFLKKSGYQSPGQAPIPSLGPSHLLATTQWLTDNGLTTADLPLSVEIRIGDLRKNAAIVSPIELPTIGVRSFDSVLIADFHTTDIIDPALLRNAGVSVWASSAETEPAVKEATEAYLTDKLSLRGTPFKVYMQSGKSIVAPKKERDALATRVMVVKFFAVFVLVALLILVGALSRKALIMKLTLLHNTGFAPREIVFLTVVKPTLSTALWVGTGCIVGGTATALAVGVTENGISSFLVLDLASTVLFASLASIFAVGALGLVLLGLFTRSEHAHG